MVIWASDGCDARHAHSKDGSGGLAGSRVVAKHSQRLARVGCAANDRSDFNGSIGLSVFPAFVGLSSSGLAPQRPPRPLAPARTGRRRHLSPPRFSAPPMPLLVRFGGAEDYDSAGSFREGLARPALNETVRARLHLLVHPVELSAELAEFIAAWPSLSDDQRKGLASMIRV